MPTHTLSFVNIYKSLLDLEPVELPSFTVISGPNGSGKTQLLEAVLNGHVASSAVQNVKQEIAYYDWTTLIPKDVGVYDPARTQTQRSRWFAKIRQERQNIFPRLKQKLVSLGIPAVACPSLDHIAEQKASDLASKVAADADRIEAEKGILKLFAQFGTQVFQSSRGDMPREDEASAKDVLGSQSSLYLLASESRLFATDSFLWGQVDAFQHAFGRLFATYRALLHENDRLEKYPPPEADERRHLDQEEFVKKYGPPPWDFVNTILAKSNLDFRIDPPRLHETVSFQPELTKCSSGVTMQFRDLSSGEKILMSFALCYYNSLEHRQEKLFPKLLLLDEVDAPLHPAMTRALLKTINEVLVEGLNVSVMMTTHSPSTVALAPEESLYVMNSSSPRLAKTSRGAALNLLTQGVPTLSVSFDGRRQVMVESHADAKLYDDLYQLLKEELNTERSLHFLAAGHKDKAGTQASGGCSQVQQIVESLVNSGNSTVFGLIDWDGTNKCTSRIHVLSEGLRDGIENLLLDPVLVTASVARQASDFARDRGILGPTETYRSLDLWDVDRWQQAANAVQQLVMGSAPSPDEAEVVTYLSSMQLQISRDYLGFDDHALEEAVLSAFPCLIPLNKNRAGLLAFVSATILPENRRLMPVDLVQTFRRLLECEVDCE